VAEEVCRGDEEDGKTKHKRVLLLLCCFLIFNYLIMIFKL
jgi:hypothetical protein